MSRYNRDLCVFLVTVDPATGYSSINSSGADTLAVLPPWLNSLLYKFRVIYTQGRCFWGCITPTCVYRSYRPHIKLLVDIDSTWVVIYLCLNQDRLQTIKRQTHVYVNTEKQIKYHLYKEGNMLSFTQLVNFSKRDYDIEMVNTPVSCNVIVVDGVV